MKKELMFSNIKHITQMMLNGDLTPTELVNTSLEKANGIKKFNSFIRINQNEAKIASLNSTERYKTKCVLSELDGIPIAIKDNFCTANIKTTCASKMLENFVPTYDATVYERLVKAGAILMGKTNLDQYAMGSGTVDSIFGPTKNPWQYQNNDSFYISGGSSGGSAVSVLTGTCFGAIGSDTGGSTRNPASYCGLIGLKPTYGLVSRFGLIPLVNSMDVPGIIARSVDDCVAILNVVAGPDKNDSTSLSKPFHKLRLPPKERISIKGLKIGIPLEYYNEHLNEEVYAVWNDVANMLKNDGAIVKQVSMPHTEHSIVCYSILNQCEVASNMARYDGIEYGFRAKETSSTEKLIASSRSIGFNEIVRSRILCGNYFLLSRNYEKYFNQALKVRRLISQDFYNVWDQVQILLTPTTLTTAPRYECFTEKKNREQCALQDYCTQPANMAGIPALSMPVRLSKTGMPLSLQIMGRSLSEPMILALAKYIESVVQFPSYNSICH